MRRSILLFFLAIGFWVTNVAAQDLNVSGRVTSQADGESLPGVTVVVAGTTIGTTTDIDGNYSLRVPQGSVLQFSFIGMLTAEVTVTQAGTYNVVMEPDLRMLDEIVVTALGIKRDRKSLGYAIQEIQGDVLMESREANLANALTGKVSGLQVIRGSTGPAGSSKIVLRGHTSLTGDNQPLIVVDGMPINNFTGAENNDYWNPSLDMGSGIGDINTEDIESISVLKGASAAALYGARAGNGVILITTKSGQKRPGLGISFSSSLGIETLFANPEMQMIFGQGSDNTFNNESNMSWGPRIEGQTVENFDGAQMQLAAYDNVGNYFDMGINQNYNLSFQQQFENVSVYTSLTHRDDKSMIPGTELVRTNLFSRAVSQFGADDRWTIDAKVQYLNAVAKNRPLLGHNPSNPYFTMYRLPVSMDIRQFDPPVDANNNMRWYGGSSQMNPYWMSENNLNRDNRDRFIMYAALSHQFTDWLSGEITAGSDMYTTSTDNRMYAGGPLAPNGQFSMSKETFFENNFSYLLSASQDNIIDRLGIAANFGGNVMMQEWEGVSGNAGQLEVPNLFALNNSTSNPSVGEWFGQKRIASLYGTLQFNWDDYLFVEGTLRNDWVSTLSPDNRSFMYPSLSVSYVFTEMMERMNSNVPSWFTFGRLRASVAQVGNALEPYQLFNTYTIGNDPLGNTTANIGGTLFNPDVQSELITSNELGADLRFFNNRLALDFTWYQTNATNQLIRIPMDPLSGFSSRMINAGNIENKGIEFMVNGRILERRDGVQWNAQFNYSNNTNRIIDLYQDIQFYRLGGFDNLSILAEAGGLYGEIYGSAILRVDDETSPHHGSIIVDANGFPLKDPEPRHLGNQQPTALMGITNTFGYRGITFSFLFDGRFGGEIFSQTNQQMQFIGTAAVTAPGGERPGVVVEGVVPNGDGTYSPNTTEITQQQYWAVLAGTDNLGINEANIYDATNVRLRYIALNYEIPRRLLANVPVQSVRVGATVNNVWLITSHMNGVDPESVFATGTNALGFENAAPPTSRTFLFNLSVSF